MAFNIYEIVHVFCLSRSLLITQLRSDANDVFVNAKSHAGGKTSLRRIFVIDIVPRFTCCLFVYVIELVFKSFLPEFYHDPIICSR